ncbi:MAG: cofactor-independent phosphoglycerate mutase [Phycisphaeraceae bacterium]|nr:cofactor-independent phosphoglycerate mutase [Phycisphaeraceae bacterium]
MKYAIIIADGAADFALEELGGKTPFEAARKPHTDRLSSEGRQGSVATTPTGMPCGSDVCCMSVLGYDPLRYHRGRAPLEAAALGIALSPSDWIFRVNLVTVIDGLMQDHSAGHISNNEGWGLLSDLAKTVRVDGMTLYPGVSYRNILVDSSGQRDWSGLVTTPPHDIPGEPMRKYLPTGNPHAAILDRMISESETLFAAHEINLTRRELGEVPATHVWPWGQGRMPQIPSFQSQYGLRGAMITAVDLLAGLSSFIAWDRLDVPGQTSYHDTDYAAAGRFGIAALDDYDLVCIHVEAPDEASHAADAKTKVVAIEAIDQHIVGPVHQALAQRAAGGEPYRMLYLPDHYTCVHTRKHDPTPVPFAVCGHHIHSVLKRPFSEANAAESDLKIHFGHELMEYFLRSGMA